jgi:hypothetical protein
MEDMSAVTASDLDRHHEVHLRHMRLKALQPKTIEACARANGRLGNCFDHQIGDLSEADREGIASPICARGIPGVRSSSTGTGSGNLISRILRSTDLEDQAEIGAWEGGPGRAQLVTECADGAVGEGIRLLVEANGQGAGVRVGQQVGFGLVDRA